MKSAFTSIVLLASLAVVPVGAAEHTFFTPNRGEADASVRFLSHGTSVNARFSDRDMSIGTSSASVRLEFAGAASQSRVTLAGDTLIYRNTWPGIEPEYAPYRGTLKSEYRVSPGADPGLIRLRYYGDGAPAILSDGSLMIGVRGAAFVESPPFAYQDRDGRVPVEVAYRINDDGTVGFALGR